MNNQANIIDVVAGIIEKDSKILIAKRKKGSHLEFKWEFPGGKIEEGETAEESLSRELKEEFEIEVKVGEFMGESIFSYKERTIRLLGYRATYISGIFRMNAHEEIKWVTAEELNDYDFAQADMPIVKKIMAAID